jgi:hypothetical protein
MWWKGIMAAPRRVVELSIGSDDLARLESIARSRREPAIRVERARILLAYQANPSSVAVGERVSVMRLAVRCCVRRAERVRVLAALEDSPQSGKAPVITPEARAWLVSLACRKARGLGYPHDLWTTRLLTSPGRARGGGRTPMHGQDRAGHVNLGRLRPSCQRIFTRSPRRPRKT